MQIIIEPNYEALSSKTGEDLLSWLIPMQNPVICTASGDSPRGLYQYLVRQVKQKNLDISKWLFVGLDEWMGMNGKDEGSCRFHLDQDLFDPLGVRSTSISFFDGRSANPEQEAARTDKFIQTHGGIDIAIVGLGINGHVGMNEPRTDPALHSHVADIAPSTQSVGQKYFKKHQALSRGITLGIANLMEARKIVLIVSGEKKSSIVSQVLEGPVTPEIPASLLRNHPNFFVYLDQAASGHLQK